ncbi:hypothetical protein J437_LFUL011190 [Ladona fulva]|uniref:Uncharacterized protein n=1 Tax=Ladona fulva TaxID=123851 RepID=A0A8K0P8K6_LADFU|nr:hypothetical protein J437_LFUL011190 [Ladona fulva]
MLPALDARKSKEKRLPIVISYANKERLITVPTLESSSGSRQAQAAWNVIVDWNVEDRVKIFCCDTTASNTRRDTQKIYNLTTRCHAPSLMDDESNLFLKNIIT